MNKGFFLAMKKPDGQPGQPFGDPELGAILMWDSLEQARDARSSLGPELGLFIFEVSIDLKREAV